MKKLYKCLKDFAPCKWKAGQDYELDDLDALGFVESGHLEPLPDHELSSIEQSLLKRLETSTASIAAQAAVKALESVHYGSGVGKGPRIEVIMDEADKTRGLGEFLQCVGFTGLQNHPKKEWAFEKLASVYSTFPDASFPERYAKSQEKMGVASYKAALAESSGITGGYTVPTEYATELLELSAEDTVLVGKTDEYAMTGRELKMPVLDQTTPTGVSGQTAYFGGVVATWTGEAITRPETEPKFKEITLVANELSGFSLASRNVLFDNKVALEQRLTRLFAGAIGWFREYAYLVGDGVAKPRGILNSSATLSVTRANAGQVSYADIAKMIGKLLPQSMKTAYWIMQQSVLQSFLQMADGSGRLIVQPYWPGAQGGPATARPCMMMLGLPIATTEKTSTLGTAGDLMLVDPKQYFTATRKDIEIAAATFSNKDDAIAGIRAKRGEDIQSQEDDRARKRKEKANEPAPAPTGKRLKPIEEDADEPTPKDKKRLREAREHVDNARVKRRRAKEDLDQHFKEGGGQFKSLTQFSQDVQSGALNAGDFQRKTLRLQEDLAVAMREVRDAVEDRNTAYATAAP